MTIDPRLPFDEYLAAMLQRFMARHGVEATIVGPFCYIPRIPS